MRRFSKLFITSTLVVALFAVFSQGVAFASGGPKQPPTQTKNLIPFTQLPSAHFTLPGVTSTQYAGATVQLYCFNPVIGAEDHFVVYIGTDYQINIFDLSDSANYATGQYSRLRPHKRG